MVAARPKLEVRTVGSEAFDDVYPLLESFQNRKMQRDDWRSMLFSYPWWDGHARGFALYAGGAAVGFLGTIFSKRHIAGREETFCNASCWVVRPEFRAASMLLLRPLLALENCTLVNLTPTARSYEIFAKLGFRRLESERLLLPAVANPLHLADGTFASDPYIFAHRLSPEENAIDEGLAGGTSVTRLLLERGSRHCYIVAALRHVRRIPFADLLYIGNPAFLWENRALAHLATFRTMRAAGLMADARFALGHDPGIALRRPAMRSYRPAHSDLAPQAVDGLFSELMVLRV